MPRLRLELKKALAERDALEQRLKQLLGRQRPELAGAADPASAGPQQSAFARRRGRLDAVSGASMGGRPLGTSPAQSGSKVLLRLALTCMHACLAMGQKLMCRNQRIRSLQVPALTVLF